MSLQLLELHHVPLMLLLLFQFESLCTDSFSVQLEEILGLGIALRVEPLLARDAEHLRVECLLASSLSTSLTLR